MKQIIKNSIFLAIIYLITSCSNNFLDENLTPTTYPAGLSNMYLSPNWQSSNYQFMLPSPQSAEYEIISKPSWLKTDSVTGTLSDSIATIQCSATQNSAFNAVGIYLDFMTVRADDINYKVPVAYITEGNPTVQVQSDLTLSYNSNDDLNLPIRNIGQGVLIWKINSMPEWLSLDTTQLKLNGVYLTQYSSYNIPLKIKPDFVFSGNLSGEIVIVTNDKEHSVVTTNITINMGTPQLKIYTNEIDFNINETSKKLSFSNYGEGKLIWEFRDIPKWLTITPSSGVYDSYTSYNDIIFSCDPTKLSPGQNSAIVTLKTNDSSHPSHSITVTAIKQGDSKDKLAVEGNITDAIFNKNTNTLYYTTTAPNKLIAYDISTRKVLNEIALSKAPTCLAITEDWTKAAVGHNGYISAINLSNNTLNTTYTLEYSVNDIAWAENDWFCYTQKGGNFSSLHWINTADGTLYDDSDKYSLDASSIIKKVPGQGYIIATRNSTSPSGFLAYDIATKSKKSYAHMDLTNFWFSENGDYIFSRNLNVYRTTSSTGSTDTFNTDINAIAKINTGTDNYYGLQHIYHCNNNLWVIQNKSYSTDESNTIYQLEDNDYTLVKKIVYDLIYQPDAQTSSYNVSANYVFANKEGTEIAVLCKGLSNDSWVIQSITVN